MEAPSKESSVGAFRRVPNSHTNEVTMNTNETLAQDAARHSEPVLHTRSGGPRGAAPAVITRRATPDDVAAHVRAGNAAVNRVTRTIKSSDALRRLDAIKQRATKALRDTNDRRERAAKRGRHDVLADEQISRVNATISQAESQTVAELRRENERLQRAVARPSLNAREQGARSNRTQAQIAHRNAVIQHLRTGQEVFNGVHLRDIERRAGVHGESGVDGGYLLAPERDTGPVERYLSNVVVMRQIATVRPISGYELTMPFNRGGIEGGWAAERQARPTTDAPELAELRFPAMELWANPQATQRMLDDSFVSIESWLADEVGIKFSEMEDAGFIGGSGQTQPQGLLGDLSRMVADTSWAAGKLGFIGTGTSGDLPSTGAFDKIIDLTTRLKSGYRQNAMFLLNRLSVGKVRTIKDNQGRYIWEPSGKDGQPQTLLNYAIAECDAMPDFAANSFPIAFGDFKRAYLIVDRVGLQVIRDPYSNKPFVGFYTTKRVGGGIRNDEAVKFLKAA